MPNKEAVKYHVHKLLDKHTQQNSYKNNIDYKQNKNIKLIINKIKYNNLTVNKADKSNALTIQNKNELLHKTLEFLTKPIYLNSKNDPTTRYQKEIKQVIKQSNLIFNNTNNFIINPNPSSSLA